MYCIVLYLIWIVNGNNNFFTEKHKLNAAANHVRVQYLIHESTIMSSGLLDNRLQVIVCHPATECISADVMIIPLTSDKLDMRQSVIGHLIADLGKYHRCTRHHYHNSIKKKQESGV